MFNFQALVQYASQAMLKKLVTSDAMYEQWKVFSQKWGLPQTSRAEFDTLVSQFNNTDPQAKLNQLSNVDAAVIQKFLGNSMK